MHIQCLYFNDDNQSLTVFMNLNGYPFMSHDCKRCHNLKILNDCINMTEDRCQITCNTAI